MNSISAACHSMVPISRPLVAPAYAPKVDVNELLSHVGGCLWGSSQDSLHVLVCLQCGGCDVLPDCRDSLLGRQEGTNSVQGVPAAVPLYHQQRKGSTPNACGCMFLNVWYFYWNICLLKCICICHQEACVKMCNSQTQMLEVMLHKADCQISSKRKQEEKKNRTFP